MGFFANNALIATETAPALEAGAGVSLTVTWPDVYGGAYDLRVVPNTPSVEGSKLALCSAPEPLSQTVSTQSLALLSRWNLISTTIDPQNPDITVVQRPISGAYSVIQSYANGPAGPRWLSYYPAPTDPISNTLHDLDSEHGYWVRVTASPPVTTTLEAARLLVVGQAVPDTTPLNLVAGWNLVSYLPQRPSP